jgi:hypothetical protein
VPGVCEIIPLLPGHVRRLYPELLSGLIPPVPKRRQQMRRKATYAARFESQGFSFPKLAGREKEKPHDTHSRGAARF